MSDLIFNESEYLAANPDVAAAVKSGTFRSGFEHYKMYGEREGRSFSRGRNSLSFGRSLLDTIVSKLARLCMFPISVKTDEDPYHRTFQRFVSTVNQIPNARLLEIGSRARSGNINTHGFSKKIRYTGLDIIPGPNVDIVGDIHSLSQTIGRESFDALFCISVFEHLGMPWKAVLEMNKVLKTGGHVFIATHSTWPLHDRPWDFYRYSTDGFRMLFHRLTGFEIMQASEGLPCRIIPLCNEPPMKGMEKCSDSYLGVSLWARKIGDPDPRLRWDIDLKEILETEYPE